MGVKEGNHTRSDGTYIETEGDGNVQTRLGVRTYLNSYHRRDAGKQREFQPYIEANYLYNSEVYAVKMNGTKISREGSRHLAELRTGVEAKLNNNLAMWGNVGVQIGDKGYSAGRVSAINSRNYPLVHVNIALIDRPFFLR
ncbi:TPA: autotransporter outer membrane beta-barrel domain-containing protein [Escherichia albertii]|nr:autotransporter outer membrane beta-barrel domain-containing protein [Escherichia albertii]